MPERETERIVEKEGVLPDGREVHRVTQVERITETPVEARSGVTGQGANYMLAVSLAVAVLAMLAVWYYFFA